MLVFLMVRGDVTTLLEIFDDPKGDTGAAKQPIRQILNLGPNVNTFATVLLLSVPISPLDEVNSSSGIPLPWLRRAAPDEPFRQIETLIT